MKIKIALIPSEHTSKAQDLSSKLQNAMEAGEMSAVDQLTEELISLTDSEYSLSLPEEYLIDMQGRSKSVFREAMRGIVPDAILDVGIDLPLLQAPLGLAAARARGGRARTARGAGMNRALRGLRILIPRGGSAGDLAAAEVRARGGHPVIAPLTVTLPPVDPEPLATAAAGLLDGAFALAHAAHVSAEARTACRRGHGASRFDEDFG